MNLINVTNHRSDGWGPAQKASFQNIIDVPFPAVPETTSEEEVSNLANELLAKIEAVDGIKNVLLQGEFSLCYTLYPLLKQKGYNIYIPTTKREVVERIQPGGTVEKTAVFKFVRWRVL